MNRRSPPPRRPTIEYVAFPYETYPFHLVVRKKRPWSFSVIEDKREPVGQPISVLRERAHSRGPRVADEVPVSPVSGLYADTEAFGVPNLLSWQVEGWEYDTLYEVEISNVIACKTEKHGAIRTRCLLTETNIEY